MSVHVESDAAATVMKNQSNKQDTLKQWWLTVGPASQAVGLGERSVDTDTFARVHPL